MMKNTSIIFTLIVFIIFTGNLSAQKNKSKTDTILSTIISGLKFRSIGPAMTSGRIADFAVNPNNYNEYYVAAACGHIWKTTNAGTTFKPVFDNYGSYSIGCLAIDPNNSNIVWAGTGENNHQRALGYGDGVYKTLDGGKTWKNMGLKKSYQIGMIAIDPRNPDIVYVAAEGSAWGPNKERGLYKTTDGGKNWEKIFFISENTGINNVVLHPENPDIVFITAEQRRRRVNTKIGGGPESAFYKSTDGGKTFRKITSGLPSTHIGGMGIAVSPVKPDVMYLIIEAAVDENNENKGGFFRSVDRGESWEKMSSYSASGQYYNEIYCDPKDVDKVYSVDTYSKYTLDGGKTWKNISLKNRHVDDHAMWIDPSDTKHFLIGGDGGMYETFDEGKTFSFMSNLPVTQFYRLAVDNDHPFYNIYGGTQDNNTLGGPSRTYNSDGISNEDWYSVLGGDGFWAAVDPGNPDIVYAEYQYGNLYRIDKAGNEKQYIKPMPAKGEKTFKWNWNAPFIISKHSKTRLYIAANKVFMSNDRGNSWTTISDDLTAKIDRNQWPVMEHYWSYDAVVKDVSTSLYGTIVAMDESDVKENLLYIGTDDGIIQVTEDIATWRKTEKFPGIPQYTYVSDIKASNFDENVVFAAFDNRKRNDFKPYLLKSTDKGKTWKSIAANLPENGTVHCIEQDFINPDLLFAGTEFGFFFTIDGGKTWTQLKSGLPTIAVRDIEIQKRENDLVLATFGRGFYILDDFSPLREINDNLIEKTAHVFKIKDALMYIQKRGKYGQGNDCFHAKNPEFGAVITYYLKETPKTKRQKRFEKEEKLFKEKKKIPQPGVNTIRSENIEDKPYILFTISNMENNVIKKIKAPAKKGINRINWDLKYSSVEAIDINKDNSSGFFAMPGKYKLKMELVYDTKDSLLADNIVFNTKLINNNNLPREEKSILEKYQEELAQTAVKINGTMKYAGELLNKIKYLKKAAIEVRTNNVGILEKIYKTEKSLDKQIFKLHGTRPKASIEEVPPEPASISLRLDYLMRRQWSSFSVITKTEKDNLQIIKEEFPAILKEIKNINTKIKEIESEFEKLNGSWTPGRIPE